MTAACSTSCTASSAVMKNLETSGWVMVTGPPAAIWRRQRGQHRALAAEHIPQPDTQVAGLAFGRQVRGQPLRHPLAVAEHAGRPGGLVGGDVHERGGTAAASGGQHRQGAPHVGEQCLRRVAFQQRQVLEGGGVEHDIRGEPAKQPAHLWAVSLMSATTVCSDTSSPCPCSDSSSACSADSSRSSRISAAGPSRCRCRHSSEPMEPPAPVTRMRLPVKWLAMAARSVCSGPRPSRSPIRGSRTVSISAVPRISLHGRDHHGGEPAFGGLAGQLADDRAPGPGQRDHDDLAPVWRRRRPSGPASRHPHPVDRQRLLVRVVVQQRHRPVDRAGLGHQPPDDLAPRPPRRTR